ncbi:endopeptidase La, partial [Acinetobacter baumannii]
NSMENVPAPLRDRMELIGFPSYTEEEKLRIALTHLLPRRAAEHGLQPNQMKVSRKIMETVIREYTREAGVRALGRELSTLCRKTARKMA